MYNDYGRDVLLKKI